MPLPLPLRACAPTTQGVLAKDKELREAFGTTDAKAICLEILAKGELQVRRGGGGAVGCCAGQQDGCWSLCVW